MKNPETIIEELKYELPGVWKGTGYAKYPTIDPTAYDETWAFEADPIKPCIHYNQKTLYKNETAQNGETVFWDTGFILMQDDRILLVSSQAGGRQETYSLTDLHNGVYTFESDSFVNDPRMVRAQRIITLNQDNLEYDLNMETKENGQFENHLKATLHRVNS